MYNIYMNRFDLEDRITENQTITEEMLETLMFAIGDHEKKPTEDQLMNMLIGFKQSQQYRFDRLWRCFEQCIKNPDENKSIS